MTAGIGGRHRRHFDIRQRFISMKKTFILSTIALLSIVPASFAQDFDFKTLDKLGASAKSSTNVTLEADMLKLASGFLSSDNDKDAVAIKSLVANLKGIYVRAYEFEKPGQYADADLAPLRAFLKQPGWKSIVDVREDKNLTQIYLLPAPNNKLGGVAIVSTEPTSVTVVYINGTMEMSDIEKLSRSMDLGIPDIKRLTDKSDKKAGK
jgi:hypothetical protein